jgi:glyoxalase family protein
MLEPIVGLHHVTAIASDPQRNLDFYTEILGLRFVKRTVNFDDPGTYHFYFGDDRGSPGTILTFFPWPDVPPGTVGAGQTSATAFVVPSSSIEFWEKRLLEAKVPVERENARFGDPVLAFADPDGTGIELVGLNLKSSSKPARGSNVPHEHSIHGFFGVTLCESGFEMTARVLKTMGFNQIGEEENRSRFTAPGTALGNHIDVLVQPKLMYGRMGAGSVHHIAPVLDRTYFHSIYFREPGGILFEIATDPPGFDFDESLEALGEALKLPPWLEANRSAIEKALPPITLHYQRGR